MDIDNETEMTEGLSNSQDLNSLIEQNIEDMDFSHSNETGFDIDDETSPDTNVDQAAESGDEGSEEFDFENNTSESSDDSEDSEGSSDSEDSEEDDVVKSLKDDIDEKSKDDSDESDINNESIESLKKEIQDLYDDPKAGIRFVELKQELKNAKSQIEEMKEGSLNSPEVQELRARASVADELKGELDSALQRLSQIDYESTPEYEQAIVAPYNELEVAASQIDSANGLEEGTTLKAIAHSDQGTQDSAIESLERSLSARSAARVNTLADQYLILNQKANVAREQAQQRMKEHSENQITLQSENAEKANIDYRSNVGQVFEKYKGKLPGFVSDEGDINEAYSAAEKAALAMDYNKMDESTVAQAVFASKVLPELVSQLQQAQSELLNQKQMTRRLSSSKPSLSSSPKGQPSVKESPKNPFALDAENDDRFTMPNFS